MNRSLAPGVGWSRTLRLTALLFVLSAVCVSLPVVRELQLRLTDSFFRLVAPAPSANPPVLVLIDDESLRAYGRWPWSRNVLAQLTRALADSGAEVIGLDVLLSEPQSTAADSGLREALGDRVVLVDKIGSYPDGPRWTEPLPDFAQKAGAVGHALAVLDSDGICRRFPPRELTTEGTRWALGVEMARRMDPRRTAEFLGHFGLSFDESAAITVAKPLLLPIYFRHGGFETVSAAAVLKGVPGLRLKGRAVLVGFGPAEISDRVITPISGELPTPGVEVHAHILDTILGGRALRELPWLTSAFLLLLTCACGVSLFSRWRGMKAVGALLALEVALFAAALGAFAVWYRLIPVGSLMLAALLSPMVVYASDLMSVERSQLRQLRELRRWLASRRQVAPIGERADISWRLELLHDLQTELGSLYELHETLLESTQDLVAIFDDGGHLLLKNRSFAQRFRTDDQPKWSLEEFRARLLANEDAPLVSTVRGTEGEAYIEDALYFVRIVPLPPTTLSPGGGTVVLLTDLATRVERDRARAEALGFIAHELRTPLVSIQGFAEGLLRYPGSPSFAAAPETIFRESKRLLALINSYLDVLRLDAGARPLRLQPVKVDELVGQVFEILQPLAAASGATLVFKNGGAPEIQADGPLLTGAVLNLVSNAIKYGQPGKEIVVTCAAQDERLLLAVKNQGVPIRDSDIARLFEPFYRTMEAESTRTGSGLGLAFVKRIAEKHQGSVNIVNRSDGVSFEIHLPVKSLTLATGGSV